MSLSAAEGSHHVRAIRVGSFSSSRPGRNSRKLHSSQSMEESVNMECSLPAAEGSRHVRAYSWRKFLFIPDQGGIAGSFITHSPWRNQLIWRAHGQPQRGHVMPGLSHVVSFSSFRPWRNQLLWMAQGQPQRGHVMLGFIYEGSFFSSQTVEE